MPLPSWLARVNRRVTNRMFGPAAGRLPLFGVIHHRGRRSGRSYRTPVNLFRAGEGFVVALTYGRTDWVRNVLASGGCEIEHRGRRYRLTAPRLISKDDAARSIPSLVRFVLSLLRVEEFLRLEPAAS